MSNEDFYKLAGIKKEPSEEEKESTGNEDFYELAGIKKEAPSELPTDSLELVREGKAEPYDFEDRMDILLHGEQMAEAAGEPATDQDRALMALQGPLMGGAENIYGALGGAVETGKELVSSPRAPFKLLGEDSPVGGEDLVESFGRGFKEYRREATQRYELARERLGPGESLFWEMAGSLAGSPFTLMGKAGSKALQKAIPTARNFAEKFGLEAAEKIAKDAGEAAPRIMKDALKGVKRDVGIGAATGAISTEAENVEDLLTDVALGGAAGGVLKLAPNAANQLQKAVRNAELYKTLKQKGVDLGKGFGDRVASFFSKMNGVPKGTIVRYFKGDTREIDRIAKQMDIENYDEYAAQVSRLLASNLEEYKNESKTRLTNIVQTEFGDKPIPEELKQNLIAKIRKQREGLSDTTVDKKIKRQMADFEKLLEAKPQQVLKRDESGNPIEVIEGREANMSDIWDLYDQAKELYNPTNLAPGQPNPNSTRFLKKIKSILYGEKGEEGTTIRKSISEIAPGVDEALKRYENLHDVYSEANKNLFVPGRSSTALRKAVKKDSPERRTLERIEKTLPEKFEDIKPTEYADIGEDIKFLLDPDVSAFSQGRSVFAPLVVGAASGLGEEEFDFGKALTVGAVLSSPMFLKAAIDAGKITKDAAKSLLQRASSAGSRVGQAAQGPTVRAAAIRELERRMFGE